MNKIKLILCKNDWVSFHSYYLEPIFKQFFDTTLVNQRIIKEIIEPMLEWINAK